VEHCVALVAGTRNYRWMSAAAPATAVILRTLTGLSLLALAVSGAVAQSGMGKRVALVVGNGAYANMVTLKNTINDARDMAAAFRGLRFIVMLTRL
jgi:type IV secretory pathway TrbF-like protein